MNIHLSLDTPTPNPQIDALLSGRLHQPFSWLGLHQEEDMFVIRVFLPQAHEVALLTRQDKQALIQVHPAGLFEWRGKAAPQRPYQLSILSAEGEHITHDPYAFPPCLSDFDLHLFNQGTLHQGYHMLGARPLIHEGVAGVCFAVWAPNAEHVSVVGDFNHWDGRIHPMRSRGSSGVWELFVPELQAGTLYKYEIRTRTGTVLLKSDPYAHEFELRPGTASRVAQTSNHVWQDAAWMQLRSAQDWLHAPMNIYEIHAGSWMRHADGRFYNWDELTERLLPYVLDMGYTHIELMPIAEHPLDESWGYQTTGYFAATRRYGSADALRRFIDACHQAGIGVLLDWVPGHFPQDGFALAYFDGTALYEHEDPRQGLHQDWGTHIFNYGRSEVKSFLLSSAHYWLSEFHFDGLRVDAVASMLYLDYSRREGEWLPNLHGGRENLDAIHFLRELNIMVHGVFPGALTLAEESTSWPGVSRPVHLGGLGFSMKWNMGWMNDTLNFMHREPVHRGFHLNQLTFHQLYAYSENFILPFSHDEVVHGKGSLLTRMPGDSWQQYANLRLLLALQMCSPGKKLNFMGNEFGQRREWQSATELDWEQSNDDAHRGIRTMMRDLNRLYREQPALHELDFYPDGFYWLDCTDTENAVIAFARRGRNNETVIIALNFTPVPRSSYTLGLPHAGPWREIFNSDSHLYDGSNLGNGSGIQTLQNTWMGQPFSAQFTLPPLACIVLASTMGNTDIKTP